MSDMNIYQRINAVMKEVKYAQKDASVQGYKAVTHDQVVATARQFFVKHGVVIAPEQVHGHFDAAVEGSKMRLYTGGYVINFVNMDKPEDKISVTIEAHALDNGDKAPGKCLTYATKSAVLKVLWLETGENDESRTKDQETITEDQSKQIIEAAKQAGLKEEDVCKVARVETVMDIQVTRFKPALAHFRKLGADAQQKEPANA